MPIYRPTLSLALVLLLAACGGGSPKPSPTPSTPVLHGTITVNTGGSISHLSGGLCQGTGGYQDMTANTQVTVKNQAGELIGTTQLGDGQGAGASWACVFHFNIANLPSASFYSIEIGHRGAINYSKADLDTANWTVTLTLGN